MAHKPARIVRVHAVGDAQNLKLDHVSCPPPGPGEVQLAVQAIGLNRAEIMFREGQYLEMPTLPAKLGYEAAGTIEALGDGVTEFSVGDRVSTVPAFSMNEHGVFGDFVNVPAAATLAYPDQLSPLEGTAIWMQYLTAYGGLVKIGNAVAGSTVLITAASSSVGIAAIQIGKSLGCKVIATSRTRAKAPKLIEHGADHVIATEEEDFAARVMNITNGEGADVLFDPVGGPQLEALASAAAPGGTIIEYGALSPEPTPYPLFQALGKQLTIRGYTLFEITQSPDKLKEAVSYVSQGIENGTLTPIIDRVFEFEEFREAYEYLASNQQIGKVVVKV
ncbi:MAG: zinc-dependent alcohol dehydrogenase family protein [Pseudomonadota bacterium]